MRCLWNALGLAVVALTAILGSSCGKSDGKLAVSGEVTLNGLPLDAGVIEFDPLDEVGTKSGAMIENGRYHIAVQHGLVPGKYRVRISAGDPNIMEPASEEEIGAPSDKNRLSKERVPPEYNVGSKQTVEVTAQGPNQFDFRIP